MRTALLLGAMGIVLTVCAEAQQPRKGIVAEGGRPDDRASTRVLYWNLAADAAAGQFAIDYGRPVWRKDYEDSAKFSAMTNGKVWRMGSNFWTTLVTDLPLSVSGRDVAPGIYYLGLQRSADGAQWSLAFIDPARVQAEHLDAFDIRKAKVDFLASMTLDTPKSTAEKLTITLSRAPDEIKNVTMNVAWGNLALSAPIKVTLPEETTQPR